MGVHDWFVGLQFVDNQLIHFSIGLWNGRWMYSEKEDGWS